MSKTVSNERVSTQFTVTVLLKVSHFVQSMYTMLVEVFLASELNSCYKPV